MRKLLSSCHLCGLIVVVGAYAYLVTYLTTRSTLAMSGDGGEGAPHPPRDRVAGVDAAAKDTVYNAPPLVVAGAHNRNTDKGERIPFQRHDGGRNNSASASSAAFPQCPEVRYEGCEEYDDVRPHRCYPRSPPPPPAPCGYCARHIHLAPGADASVSMTVSFATDFSCGPDVEAYVLVREEGSKKEWKRHASRKGDRRWYTSTSCDAADPADCRRKGALHCHSPVHFGTYVSDHFHHVRITGLKPDTTYVYDIVPRPCNRGPCGGNSTVNIGERKEEEEAGDGAGGHDLFFRTAPARGEGYGTKIAFLADVGQSEEATTTFDGIDRDGDVHFMVIAGDISYANRDHRLWDSWFDKYEGVFSHLPVITAPGNHDMDPDCCDWSIFKSYQSRFAMPDVKPAVITPACLMAEEFTNSWLPGGGSYEGGNAYFSVTMGVAHIIVLNTYSDSAVGSEQYVWLEEELQSNVDRQKTPWLFVVAHANIYESFRRFHFDDAQTVMKRDMEPLFLRYGVNAFLAGHDHAYSRTGPIFDDLPSERGPTYVTIGNAGRGHHQKKAAHDQPWVATWDDWSFGYGTMTLINATHAYWETRFHNRSKTEFVPNTDRTYLINHHGLVPHPSSHNKEDGR